MRHFVFFCLNIFCLFSPVFAQEESEQKFKMGNWRVHFPYNQAKFIAVDYPVIWVASYSGMYSYNEEEGTIERYNKINGLSDMAISAFKYHYPSKSLLIGYESGNIDIYNNGKFTNISDIYRAEIIGDKTIKSIKYSGDSIFIVNSFGISLMNLNSRKILATYRFGTSLLSVEINDIAVFPDSLFAATNKGVFSAPRKGLNLLDFNNWKQILNIPNPESSFNFCESWADTLWLGKTIEGYQNDEIYMYKKGNFRQFDTTMTADIHRINAADNYLYIVTRNSIYFIKEDATVYYRASYWGDAGTYTGSNDAYMRGGWNYYLADPTSGLNRLIRWSEKNNFLTVNGPAHYQSYHVNAADDEVWISGGSPNAQWANYGIYRLKNNFWENYNHKTTDSLIGIPNISLSVTNPQNPQQVIGGSHGYGIVEFLNGKINRVYNPENSLLENISPYGTGYNRITGMVFDQEQNLWIAQSTTHHQIVVLLKNGEWKSFLTSQNPLPTREMIITEWGDVWVIIPNAGILVFNTTRMLNGDNNAYKLFEIRKSDNTTITDISAIAIDNDETVWLGIRTGGILVYYNPRNALQSTMLASQLMVQVDERVEYLFGTEMITDIKVDGGNRKWITTEGGGTYLMSEGGNKQILNLTTKNSPLISDKIYSVDINNKTGEVFFATDLGVTSYVGSATKGNTEMNKLDIYPNPVHPDYYGHVTIRGLMENTKIKITDIEGKLVYETYSNGGIGIWNVCDFNGLRVPTGIYFVFCALEDGSSVTSGKVFVTGKK